MFTLAALAALTLPAPDAWSPEAGVCLSDARLFRVHPHEARAGWKLACDHPAYRRWSVHLSNAPDVAARWEAECDWRRAVWDKIDNVLYCDFSARDKLRSLARLRELLGDEAYFAGALPPPIPTYRD